jgi:hypothetical protein
MPGLAGDVPDAARRRRHVETFPALVPVVLAVPAYRYRGRQGSIDPGSPEPPPPTCTSPPAAGGGFARRGGHRPATSQYGAHARRLTAAPSYWKHNHVTVRTVWWRRVVDVEDLPAR